VGQKRHHYERAFESLLRDRRIPYVSVDEARRTLVPVNQCDGAIKSFDFVVSSGRGNLLVDVKGRRCTRAGRRLESWVTVEDLDSLSHWERLFGPAFRAAFVFLYWCDLQPPDALFQEVFEYSGRWYAVRTVGLEPYRRAMRIRSRRWGTVDLPPSEYERLSEPFLAPSLAAAG